MADPIWKPHALPIEDRLPPAHWRSFVDEITRLFHLIERHPTLSAAVRMNNRSVRKMATVVRTECIDSYVQTGLVQRGLGFGWRMNDLGLDLNELRPFFRLMPVSIGVAFTKCPADIIDQRNRARLLVRETRHEDRHRIAALMAPAIDIAKEELNARGVPVIEIDTTLDVECARAELVAFADKEPHNPAPGGPDPEAEIFFEPPWWQRS